jgi:hypothetical protein
VGSNHFNRTGIGFATALVWLNAAGCGGDIGQDSAADPTGRGISPAPVASLASSRHVDSIFTPEESVRRFRVGLPAVAGLSGGARSREGLVRKFVRAVERSDTATIRRLVLDRAEFAYLYYPSSPYAAPPYSQPPGLMWFQIQLNSEKGIVRVLRRFGGQPVPYKGHVCSAAPLRQGENRFWQECTMRLSAGGGTAVKRLFGAIVERGGRFKFVSYANDF